MSADYVIQTHPRVSGCRCNVINVTMTGDRTRKYRRYVTPDCSLHRTKTN